MTLDLIIGGMPRGGTTVAAKLMSLHPDIFCYAGETHLIPLMHGMFGQLPCRKDKVDLVAKFLHQQFKTAMIEMPRFSVSQGAHPRNLIFEEKDIDELVEAIRSHLEAQLYGVDLYRVCLVILRNLLSKSDHRPISGEKTPNNVFAMADYGGQSSTKNIVVMREPIGVLRSMKARVEGGDAYAGAFKGDLERNIGMYLEYALAARQILNSAAGGTLVRYEDMAENPAAVVGDLYKLFDRKPEESVIQFVEGKWDREIADRAPMNYKRLKITAGCKDLSPLDVWKVYSLTRELRETFGYSDTNMAGFGFEVHSECPDVEVPLKVLPLYGFHQTGWMGGSWMKRKGGLIVYLGKGRSHDVRLDFKSKIPEQVRCGAELRISVNDIQREVITVATGNRSTAINLKVKADELIPMGNRGGYAIVGLESTVAYCKVGHTANGTDAREISFYLNSWKIDKSRFNWWRR